LRGRGLASPIKVYHMHTLKFKTNTLGLCRVMRIKRVLGIWLALDPKNELT